MKKIYTLIVLLALVACSQDNDGATGTPSSGTGKSGSLARFTIINNYMYAVDHTELKIFNVATANNPVLVNMVHIGFNIETISSFQNYLYIGANNGMFIYDIQNPESPTYMAEAMHFTACDPVVANAYYAFVTLHSENWCGNNINRLEIYDISNITYPVYITQRNLTYPKGLALYNNYLFVCDDEVKIFDVSNPAETYLVTSINIAVTDVIIHNNTAILIGENGLHQYQLNPDSITEINELSTIEI